MHNKTTWNEKLLAGKLDNWYHWYLSKDGVGHYAINYLLYMTTMREKYAKMYESFISQLLMYPKVIRCLLMGYLPISLLPLQNCKNSRKVKKAI